MRIDGRHLVLEDLEERNSERACPVQSVRVQGGLSADATVQEIRQPSRRKVGAKSWKSAALTADMFLILMKVAIQNIRACSVVDIRRIF